ncbi:unnamed protein product [Adineta ricciae]|uniref:RING-type domain-containing protein n=1 Tax=Adineta ricciae TaxID=249248 RepID=A0A813ZVP8_ADIRI|nr:unnamed protein product [Adineta ricciae]CAF0949955.1 unnamed protein product [Adineta ricciae]
MQAAGFSYTGLEDTARCQACGLEVSEWTADTNPFTIHKQRSPACTYVRSMMPDKSIITPVTIMSTTDGDYNPAKRQKKDLTDEICESTVLTEITLLSETRRRSFSHWPLPMCPSSAQMVEAGFFCCNFGDRVICLYCNLICQQWTPQTDDPSEIHKKLSPKCPYVIAMTKHRQTVLSPTVTKHFPSVNGVDPFQCVEMTRTAACHTAYIEIPRRQASFETWPNENLPPVDELVRAGFFYTGSKTVVTCFYCNGSLQNWGPNDNPTIEHARWFPNCAYAKQLCGVELYKKIQESKKAQQERAKANDTTKQDRNANSTVGRGQLIIPDEITLSQLVAARLDLPVSRRLLSQNFKVILLKRVWKDHLCLRCDSLDNPIALWMYCTILQRQIEVTCGNKDSIIVPRVAMQTLLEKELAGIGILINTRQRIRCWTRSDPTGFLEMELHWNLTGKIQSPIANFMSDLLAHNVTLEASASYNDPLRINNSCAIIKIADKFTRYLQLKHNQESTERTVEPVQSVPCNLIELLKKQAYMHSDELDVKESQEEKEELTQNGGLHFANNAELINTAMTPKECLTNSELRPVVAQDIDNHQTTSEADTWANLCVLCLEETRTLAFVPCGHLSTCVPCGHSLKLCPTCCHKIEGYIRINL